MMTPKKQRRHLPDEYHEAVQEQWQIISDSLAERKDDIENLLHEGEECEDVFSLQDANSPWRNKIPLKYYPAALIRLLEHASRDVGEHLVPVVALYCWKSFLHKAAVANLTKNDLYIDCIRVLDEYVGFEEDPEEFENVLYNINTDEPRAPPHLIGKIQAGGQLWKSFPGLFKYLHPQPSGINPAVRWEDDLNELGRFIDRACETSVQEEMVIMGRLNDIAQDVSEYFEAALIHRVAFTGETASHVCSIIGWMEQQGISLPRMGNQTCLDIIEAAIKDPDQTEMKMFGRSALQRKTLTRISRENLHEDSAEKESTPARKILF